MFLRTDLASSSSAGAARARRAAAIREELPHPLHLFEHLTSSGHYHLGHFRRDGGDSVAAAMDRVAETSATFFRPRSRVLDLGCGMGGSAAQLARRGHVVLGIDPSSRAIEYGRRFVVPSRGVELRCLRIEELAPEHGGPEHGGFEHGGFDGVLITEVLQYFPDLGGLLGRTSRLLRPDGVVVVNELAAVDFDYRPDVPYHRAGALAAAAQRAGLRVEGQRDLTRAVAPSMTFFENLLLAGRESLARELTGRDGLEREIEEVVQQCRNLLRGVEQGHLRYQSTVLRVPGG